MDRKEDNLIKVSSGTPVPNLAASINHKLAEQDGTVVLRAIGAGAVNQAVKGAIVANESLVKRGKLCTILPRYKKIDDITSVELKLVITDL